MKLAELDLNGFYTYLDYLKWTFNERVELIKGRIFEMSAPNRAHQDIALYISVKLYNFLNDKSCKVYIAPFDVRLNRKTKNDNEVINVFQPDICVVCDLTKLDTQGCNGAPDIVIEILSPSNNEKELKNKYDVYEECSVKEYWIVIPQLKAVVINTLIDGKYNSSRLLIAGDTAQSTVLEGFSLDLKELFINIG